VRRPGPRGRATGPRATGWALPTAPGPGPARAPAAGAAPRPDPPRHPRTPRSDDEGAEDGTATDLARNFPTSLPLLPPGVAPARSAPGEKPRFVELETAAEDDSTRAAAELRLDGPGWEDLVEELLLVQLPETLPATAAGPAGGAHVPLTVAGAPPARLGSLVVYDDGSVGLRVGDVEMDVSAPDACGVHQEAAAINASSADGGHCVVLGPVDRSLVVTPDVEALIAAGAGGTGGTGGTGGGGDRGGE